MIFVMLPLLYIGTLLDMKFLQRLNCEIRENNSYAKYAACTLFTPFSESFVELDIQVQRLDLNISVLQSTMKAVHVALQHKYSPPCQS